MNKKMSKTDLKKIIQDNKQYFNYGQDCNFGKRCIDFIEDNKLISFDNDLQKKFYETMFSHMDTVTAFHAIEASFLAKNVIKEYGECEFVKNFKIDKDSFIKGMLLHDCGKIFVEAEALITSKNFRTLEEEERADKISKIKKHTDYYQEALEIINEEIDSKTELNKIFSKEITDIGRYHHIENNKDNLASSQFNSLYSNNPCFMVATQIDVFEAMRTDFRPYKESVPEKDALRTINNKIDMISDKSYKILFSNLNTLLEKSRATAIHKDLRTNFDFELVCAERATYKIDNLFEKFNIDTNVDITIYDKKNLEQYRQENEKIRNLLALEK